MRSPVSVVAVLLGLASVCEAQGPAPRADMDMALLDSAFHHAVALPKLRSLLVSRHGTLVRERYFHGASATQAANIKSASKSFISALIGIAIQRGDITGVKQPIAPFFKQELAPNHDPRIDWITIEDLLTMRSGLTSTSFANYNKWVSSRNWVKWSLTQPMTANPGAEMDYSTGNTHLLSVIITRASKLSTYDYATRYLTDAAGIDLAPWPRDPQGVYFGGNNMWLTPRAMVAFGNLYLHHGRSAKGKQLVPADWIDSSWVMRTRSSWSNMDYGYGWWTRPMGGYNVKFAWGYGGQFIFIVPELDLTIVTTSDPTPAERSDMHLERIYDIVGQYVIPAAIKAGG